MRELVARSREAFWSVPALVVVLSIVLAQTALAIDHWADGSVGVVPDALLLGVDGSRAMLGAVGGAVLAVAGTTFSITISVIATASSTYGPRLVRNFMTDRRNQTVLGLFVGTFVYCMIVLRSITSQDENVGTEAFVPFFSVYASLLLALVNVAALVYFLHHIAESIQIGYLIARVRRECETVADRYYAPAPEDHERCAVDDASPAGPTTLVVARDAGSVTMLDEGALVAVARRHGTVIRMLVGPGSHLLPGEPVAELGGAAATPETGDEVLAALTLGGARTPAQDMAFAIQQLTEIAVRALSPGTNDPYTARTVLSEIARPLQVITAHPAPQAGRCDEDGDLRLVLTLPDATTIVDDVFDDLRTHGAGDPHVVRAVVDLAARLHRTAPDAVGQRLRAHAEELVSTWSHSASPFDLARMRSHLDQAFEAPTPG